jgi:signal peptidase II
MAPWLWLWLSAFVVALDQAAKWVAELMLPPYQAVVVAPFVNLTLVYNEGAAFSFLAGAGGWQRWAFAGFALAMTVLLGAWLLRLKPHERLSATAIALIIGGAAGNLIDRVLTGRVVDFIDVYYGAWHWPAFNVADSAITVGVVLLLIASLRSDTASK